MSTKGDVDVQNEEKEQTLQLQIEETPTATPVSRESRIRTRTRQSKTLFVAAHDNIVKFIGSHSDISLLPTSDLKNILIETGVLSDEITFAFNQVEDLLLEGEDIPQRHEIQTAFDEITKQLIEFKRNLKIRYEILKSDEIENSIHVSSKGSRKSKHSAHSTSKSERLRQATIDAKVLEIKIKAEHAKQEIERAKLQQEQHIRTIGLETDLAEARIKEEVENTPDHQLESIEIKIPEFVAPSTKDISNPQQPTDINDETTCMKLADTTTKPMQSDLKALETIMARTTLPPLKPIIFDGNKLMYQKWRSSFRVCFEKRTEDPEELMGFLADYTKGDAYAIIESKLYDPSLQNFRQAMDKLKEEFGNPIAITEAYVKELESWPKIKYDDAKGMKNFGNFLDNCHESLKIYGYEGKLNDATVIRNALLLLPKPLVNRFREEIQTLRGKKIEVKFTHLVEYVRQRARALGDPVFGEQPPDNKPTFTAPTNSNRQPYKRSRSLDDRRIRATGNSVETKKLTKTTNTTKTDNPPIPRCLFCRGEHWLEHCEQLRKKPVKDRRDFLRHRDMCSRCTFRGHEATDCPNTHWKTCKICKNTGHITLFHGDSNNSAQPLNPKAPAYEHQTSVKATTNSTSDTTNQYCSLAHLTLGYIRHPSQPDNKQLVYIYTDAESDTCFVEEEFSRDQGWDGHMVTMELTTMHGQNEISSQQITDLEVLNLQMTETFKIPLCYTRPTLPIDRNQIPTREAIKEFPHLQRILPEIPDLSNVKIAVMIGRNVPLAVSPREVIAPDGPNSPWAERNGLGWSVLYADKPTNQRCNFINVRSTSEDSTSESLIIAENESVKIVSPKDILRLFEQDFSENKLDNKPLSKEDKKFNDKIDNSLQYINGHYQMDLPFRHEPPTLFNNRSLAESSLLRLKKKFDRNPDLKKEYSAFMNKMVTGGHIEEISEDERCMTDVHYLTHHFVRHKRKGKLRVVFNASLKFRGISLNDELLQGPDLLSNLVGSLCRMRKGNIAFTCDIDSMFMMVRITPKHRDYVRILWWEDGDITKPATEYKTCYHLFGAISSPSCCIRALHQTAIDNEDDYPTEVQDFVLNNFYMDDGTTSVDRLDEAINLAWGAIKLCSKGGFTLSKFASNSKHFLQSLPSYKRTAEVNETFDFEIDHLPTQRTLGMIWDTNRDYLKYQVNLPDQPLTRRGCLSILSSVFDPLGIIAPVMLPGRSILQEACRLRLSWDDPLPADLAETWQQWQARLTNLENLLVPRCFKPDNFEEIKTSELHLFSDASTYGYGGVAYLRQTDINDNISVSLVMGKSRVVPLKAITIPRLELTSAVTMVKVANLLTRELRIPDLVLHFWTDSTCVLGYIHNEVRRFKTFVAHRIQYIIDHSDVEQWHYISTKSNPADIASRGIKPEDIAKSIWLTGPPFLTAMDEFYNRPDTTNYGVPDIDGEMKIQAQTFAVMTDKTIPNNLILNQLQQISSWHGAKQIISVWIHLIKIYKSRARGVQIDPVYHKTAAGLQEAEDDIIKLIQKTNFEDEVKTLTIQPDTNSKPLTLKKSSSLIRLNPFADNKGILRVGGRIKHSILLFEEKHPIIIPKKGHLIKLLIRHYHIRQAHSGRNITLNAIRSRFWIINGPSAVRHYLTTCVTCSKLRGRPQVQLMNDLPEDRVVESAPFHYSACDLFGPFKIKVKRSEVKRYGLIFSCQSTRAVHIEILHSMTTDSFLCGLRRFICRRGQVKHIRSDCGSQIVGASTELEKLKKELNQSTITNDIFRQFDCEIKFLPSVPYAPHFHGSWERQIQSIRRVFEALLHQHGNQLNDESLVTLMVEAEAVVNSRPLTTESLADPEIKPLSPANILTLKSGVVLPPPGNFTRQDLYLQKQWRRVQYVVNEFWSRWKKEVLQSIQQRQKWQLPIRNLMVGDIILMVEDNTTRNNWPMMIVERVHPSTDGRVRKVDIATTKGELPRNKKTSTTNRRRVTYTRAIHQLILLVPGSEPGSEQKL